MNTKVQAQAAIATARRRIITASPTRRGSATALLNKAIVACRREQYSQAVALARQAAA